MDDAAAQVAIRDSAQTGAPQPGELAAVDARVARALDQWWASLPRELGPLSRPQRRTLRTLADREARGMPTRVGDIALLLRLSTAGATRMLDTLVGLGFAARYREPHTDQRQVHVALSALGRDALARSDEAFYRWMSERLASLTRAERETLASLMERLEEAPATATPDAIAETE